MKSSVELQERLLKDPLKFSIQDFNAMKRLFETDRKSFIHIIEKLFNKIKKVDDFEIFFYVMKYLNEEIKEISIFLSSSINRIFFLLFRNNRIKTMADYSYLIEKCGNIRTFEILSEILRNQTSYKFIDNLELYRFKKVVYELSNLLDMKNDVTAEIKVQLESADLSWMENLDD